MTAGLSIALAPLLRQVPLAVLFGVFLYMGIVSLNGIQMVERAKLMFMPVKHHPDVPYTRKVGPPAVLRAWSLHPQWLDRFVPGPQFLDSYYCLGHFLSAIGYFQKLLKNRQCALYAQCFAPMPGCVSENVI